MNTIGSRFSVFFAALVCLFSSGSVFAAPDFKKGLDDWTAAFNSHDLDRVAAVYSPDVVIAFVKPSGWVEEHGQAAARKALAVYFTAFPDVRLAPTRVFHKGDLLIVEWVSDGTNTGSLAGAPPSGKRAGISGVGLLWFDGKGLIKRSEALFDEVTLAQQTGAAPGPARAVPTWPTTPATWIEADAPTAQAKTIAAAKATWPQTWTKHDRAGYDAAVTDDGVHVELAGPTDFKGRAALLAEFDTYAKAMPDMRVQINQAWGFGNTAVLKFTFSGTMKGPIGPFKPTNKKIVIHAIDVDDLRDGKMAMGVTYSNATELLTHLGVLPPAKR